MLSSQTRFSYCLTGPKYRLRPGVSAEDVEFGDLGYASVALDSYAIFCALRNQGTIPVGTRFQVGLPTPMSFAIAFMSTSSQAAVIRALGLRFRDKLAQIFAAIPAGEL